MSFISQNAFVTAQIMNLLREDIRSAVDDADLTRRLSQNGFGFRDTKLGRILVTLPHMVEVGPLNA